MSRHLVKSRGVKYTLASNTSRDRPESVLLIRPLPVPAASLSYYGTVVEGLASIDRMTVSGGVAESDSSSGSGIRIDRLILGGRRSLGICRARTTW